MTEETGNYETKKTKTRKSGAYAKCKSCGARIRWIKLKDSGNWIPCDTATSVVQVITRMVSEGEVFGTMCTLYTSHFATCPNAEKHRKPKQEKPDDEQPDDE